MKKFRNIIIGSGQAANPLAGFLAQKGEPTLLIEKNQLGGSCVNFGCTPSKAMYESVRKIHHGKTAGYAGFEIRDADFNFEALMDFVRQVRDTSNQALQKSLEETDNLTIVRGHARFTASRTIRVTQKEGQQLAFEAERIFINTGSHPSTPPLDGIDQISYLTNLNIFDLREQPKSLLILGGGYIGLEFAQMFARIGTQVSVIESSAQPMSQEDEDLSSLLREKLEDEGVVFETGSRAKAAEASANGISVKLENGKSISAEKLLIAVGRTPNTTDLGLEHTSIETDDNGHIKTDARLRSTQEEVYAMGEVAGSPYFTHISYDDYRILKDVLDGSEPHKRDTRQVPYCMFTDPQLAGFGLNEQQAKSKNINYHLYKMPMAKVARAGEMNETTGLIKVLCDAEGGKIIGVRILGVEAGEMMSVLQVAARAGMTASDLKNFIFAHPVLAEGFNNLFA